MERIGLLAMLAAAVLFAGCAGEKTPVPIAAEEPGDLAACVTHFQEGMYARAFPFCERAAAAGRADAQFNLGTMYRKGMGVEKDARAAVHWFQLAGEQGMMFPQYNLGVMFGDGEGVAKDLAQSAAWFRLAAEQGYILAQLRFGKMLAAGNGVGRDTRAAAHWFYQAAIGGNVAAQYRLGALYHAGDGVTKDAKRAAALYRRAALSGQADAQNRLGAMLLHGEGIAKDETEAYVWLFLAADNDAPGAAGMLERLDEALSPAALQTATDRAEKIKTEIANQPSRGGEKGGAP